MKTTEFYETLPLRKLDSDGRNLWCAIYQANAQQQGHTISSTIKSKICDCFTCQETIKQLHK